MSLFCNHDWAPRSGMDSGSYCVKCFSVSNKETILGSGLNNGKLQTDRYNGRINRQNLITDILKRYK